MAKVVCLKIKAGVEVQGCDVYVGRGCFQGGHKRKPSIWGNPYKIGMVDINEVGDAVLAYWKWIHLPEQAHLRDQIPTLKGKVLGCHCKKKGTEPCHGDVPLYLANGIMTPALAKILKDAQIDPNQAEQKTDCKTLQSLIDVGKSLAALQANPNPKAASQLLHYFQNGGIVAVKPAVIAFLQGKS